MPSPASPTSRKLLLHAAASTFVGVLVASFYQSDAFALCCASTPWLQAIFLPAILLAFFVGGGVFATGELVISAFMVLQVVAMWFLGRFVLALIARRRAGAL